MPVGANPVHSRIGLCGLLTSIALALAAPLSPAGAELVISQLVIELTPSARTADIEIRNDSEERRYVLIEPREVLAPGTSSEKPFVSPDPEVLGLLVSPRRVILEPGQGRAVRIAGLGGAGEKERVYRVTIKPVVGELSGSDSGLKLLVGYDLLVLARPADPTPKIVASRDGPHTITLTNVGNSSAELIDGKQCEPAGKNCQILPSKRLYSGASWKQTLPLSTAVQYRVRSSTGSSVVSF